MDYQAVMQELEALGKERTKKFIARMVQLSLFLAWRLVQ